MNGKLLTANQMLERYGSFYEAVEKVSIDRQHVQHDLWALIPYAELWGVADDLLREQRVQNAPTIAVQDLVVAVRDNDDLLDHWLAGDEADHPNPSHEYVAFSAMRMAADFA
jgi:hypothetical protein